MVYTVTFNPAIDYIMELDDLRYNDVNRSRAERMFYGGKGINVSVTLTRLGIENIALGFIGGFTGDSLEKMLIAEGIACDFCRLSGGDTRINVKIKADKVLEINAPGPFISEAEIKMLLEKINSVKQGDYVVLAGSVPSSVPDNIYETILSILKDKGAKCIVDASGELLANVLRYEPFLIKPNHIELGDLFGIVLKEKDEIIKYAKKLQEMGAKNVLVSCGADGAVLLDEYGEIFEQAVVKGEEVNSVGCGDSMLGGFIAGYTEKGDYGYALKLGSACGNATAFCDAIASRESIYKIFEML